MNHMSQIFYDEDMDFDLTNAVEEHKHEYAWKKYVGPLRQSWTLPVFFNFFNNKIFFFFFFKLTTYFCTSPI